MFPADAPLRIPLPASPLRAPGAGEPPRSRQRRKRDLVRRASAIGALRRAGVSAGPQLLDDQGERLPDQDAAALATEAEEAIRELSDGRPAHARRTIAALEASRKSGSEQVDELLNTTYEAHARRDRSSEVLDAFLDTFERWLTQDGLARVDRLFDHVDLDRAPESLGLVLLATTRLTRACFGRREAFVGRLRAWLIGRSGRTVDEVDNLLRGLRE